MQWALHDVRFHRSGAKRIHHPLVGDLTLAYERLELPADPGLAIATYSPGPTHSRTNAFASSPTGRPPVRA